MKAKSTTLIAEKGNHHAPDKYFGRGRSQYPFQVFSPPLMADNGLTLLASKYSQVPKADRDAVGNEERGAIGATPLNITSHSLSTSSELVSNDPTLGNIGRGQ